MPAADGYEVAFTSALSRLILVGDDGRPRWVAEHRQLRDTAPRFAGDLLVAATESGLAAFDRATGATRWTAQLGERANTPTAGPVLVASTWDDSMFGVDAGTGATLWRVALPGAALGPAGLGPGGVAVTTWASDDQTAAGAVAVEAVSGRQLWSVLLPAGGVSAPAVVALPGPAVAPTAAKRAHAGAGGAASPTDAGGSAGAGAGDHVVVVVAGDVAAHGLALATGQERWATPLDGSGAPEVVPLPVGEGKVLAAHRLGGMALLSAADGRVEWTAGGDAAAVRGAPAGPGPGGRFAFPLDDGRVLLAGPGRPTSLVRPPGRASGVTVAGPHQLLAVATREAPANALVAFSGW
jgi:outer membrane protein assembly factor BamB